MSTQDYDTFYPSVKNYIELLEACLEQAKAIENKDALLRRAANPVDPFYYAVRIEDITEGNTRKITNRLLRKAVYTNEKILPYDTKEDPCLEENRQRLKEVTDFLSDESQGRPVYCGNKGILV